MILTREGMVSVENFSDLFANMIEGIRARIPLHAVILFGSRARGEALPHSDYDLVVIGDFAEPFIHRSAWVVQLAPTVAIDVFCYTPAEFERMFSRFRLTAIDAIGEGIPLFGAGFLRSYQTRYYELVERGMRKTDCTLIPPAH